MNKRLIIDSGGLPFSIVIKVVELYIKYFSYTKEIEGWLGLKDEVHFLLVTGKYPKKLKLGNNSYYLQCKENKNSFKITVWRGN